MKELSATQLFIYNAGGIVMVIGAILCGTNATYIGAALYTIGTIGFASMQLIASYQGKDSIVKRLRRQQVSGAILLLLSTILLWAHLSHRFVYYLRGGEWKALLLIATVFEVYTAFRLPQALKDSESKKQ